MRPTMADDVECPTTSWCALLPKLSSASTVKPEPVSSTRQYKSGASYDGQFLQDLKVGYGLCTWPDGASYEGEFVNDNRQGKGKQEWPDGSLYRGDFQRDQRHGEGVQKWANGEKYAGQFCKDRRHGVGRYTWPDGSMFEGTFFLGRKEGYGTFHFTNGASFAGLYKNDEREGPGVMTYGESEQQDVGLWRGQQLIRTCESLPGFFSLADSKEYSQYVDEQRAARNRISLESACPNPMRVIDRYVNPPRAFRHEYEPDIRNKVHQIFSNTLHTRSLAMDMRSFHESSSAGLLSERMRKGAKIKFSDSYGLVWNKTPSCLAMQKHILTYKPNQKEAGFPVKSVLFGAKRDQFGRAGWQEIMTRELHEAAQNSDLAIVNKLLSSGDLCTDVADLNGNTPLIASSIRGHLDVINVLLDEGANVNHLNNEGLSALAACHVKLYAPNLFRYNTAEKNIERPPDFQQETGYDPSLLSAKPSRRKGGKTPEASKQSLEQQDSANDANSSQDQTGRLQPKRSSKKQNVSSENLEIDVSVADDLNLEAIEETNPVEVFDIDASERQLMHTTIELLLRRGADPDASTMPMPVLFFAVKACDVEAVKTLLLKGASTNSRLSNKKGALVALHVTAAMPGQEGVEMTNLLLDSLADPDVCTAEDDSYIIRDPNEEFETEEEASAYMVNKISGGRTPLHIACARQDNYQNAALVVRSLLEHNANPDILCNGYSPLALAITSGNDLAVDELLDYGANPNLKLGEGIGNALCVAAHIAYESRRSPEARVKLIDKLIEGGADILHRVRVGSKISNGTLVDYAHHVQGFDERIGHLPYRALKPHERDIYNARRALVDHLGHTLRRQAAAFFRKNAEDRLRSPRRGLRVRISELMHFCGGCGRSVDVNLTPCPRCKQAYYCSKVCKAKAWEAGHKYDCEFMDEAGKAREARGYSPPSTVDIEVTPHTADEIISKRSSLEPQEHREDEESVASSASDETYHPIFSKKQKAGKVQWDIDEKIEAAISDSDYGSDTDAELRFLKKLDLKQPSDISLLPIDAEQAPADEYAIAQAATQRKKSAKLRKKKKRTSSKGASIAGASIAGMSLTGASLADEDEFDMTRDSQVELYAIMKDIRIREGLQKDDFEGMVDEESIISDMKKEAEKRNMKRDEIKRKKKAKEKALSEKMMVDEEEKDVSLKVGTQDSLLPTSDTDVQLTTSEDETRADDEGKKHKKTRKTAHEKQLEKQHEKDGKYKTHKHLGVNEVFSFFVESESSAGFSDVESDDRQRFDTEGRILKSSTDGEERAEEARKGKRWVKKERKSRKDKKDKKGISATTEQDKLLHPESDQDRSGSGSDVEVDSKEVGKQSKKTRKREKKVKGGADRKIEQVEDLSEKSSAVQDATAEDAKGSKERKARKGRKVKSRKGRKKGALDKMDVSQEPSEQESGKELPEVTGVKGRKAKTKKVRLGKGKRISTDERGKAVLIDEASKLVLKDEKGNVISQDKFGAEKAGKATSRQKSRQRVMDRLLQKERLAAQRAKAKAGHDAKVVLHYKDIKEKKRLRAGKIVKESEKEPKHKKREKEIKDKKDGKVKIQIGDHGTDEEAKSEAASSAFDEFSEIGSDEDALQTAEEREKRARRRKARKLAEDEGKEGEDEGKEGGDVDEDARRSTMKSAAKRREEESMYFMWRSGRLLYDALDSAAKGGCGSKLEKYKAVYLERNIKSRWFVPAPLWVKGKWRSKSAENEYKPRTQGGTYLPQSDHGYGGNYSYV